MNKILKILSILIIGFVMFSCSTPTNDPTNPVEETPAVPTYSITFTTKNSKHKLFTDYLNSLPKFKNLEEGDEVMLYKHLYCNEDFSEITTEIVNNSVYDYSFKYYCNNSEIDSVGIGNESVEVELSYYNWSSIE